MILQAILAPILEIISKVIPDATLREKLQADITKAAIENEKEYLSSITEVILAEAKGESWMQRNWRPCFSFLVMGLWCWTFITDPLVEAAFGVVLKDIPSDDLTNLTMMWSGVYGLSRSFEKSGSSIKIGASTK